MTEELNTLSADYVDNLEAPKPTIDADQQQSMYKYFRDPSRIYRMPYSAVGAKMRAAIRENPDQHAHLVTEYDLHNAWEFATEKKEFFGLRKLDSEIEKLIEAGIEAGFECMNYEHSTVTGTIIYVIDAMLRNHRALAKYVEGPAQPEVRSISEIHRELSGEYPRSVRILMYELDDALNETSEGTGPESALAPHPWEGVRPPLNLPMDCLSGEAEGEAEGVVPFDATIIELMQAADGGAELGDIFGLSENSQCTREALRAALIYFLNAMNHPKASVCGLLVETLKRFIRSHYDLAGHVDFNAVLAK